MAAAHAPRPLSRHHRSRSPDGSEDKQQQADRRQDDGDEAEREAKEKGLAEVDSQPLEAQRRRQESSRSEPRAKAGG